MQITGPPTTWTIWSVIKTMLALTRQHFVTFFAVALVLNVPLVATNLADIGSLPVWVMSIICNALLGISFTHGTLKSLGGQVPDTGSMLLQLAKPITGAWLVVGLAQTAAIFAGLCLLLVPGLYLLSVWMVALPAMMVEGTSFRQSFARSASLTQHRRWRVLGAFVSCFLIAIAYVPILFPLLGALDISTTSDTFKLLSLITGSLTSMALYTVPPALYVALRREKEGTTAEEVAASVD